MAPNDAPEKAKDLGGAAATLVEPIMMFSTVYPEHKEAPEIFRSRIRQAAAAGIPSPHVWPHAGRTSRIVGATIQEWGPIAQDNGVLLVIKQHGGETGTGKACAEIVQEVAHPAVKVNYDAGNVMDYLDLDPIPDIRSCASEVRSFCIKDHRNFPRMRIAGLGLARSTTINCRTPWLSVD